MNLDEPLPAKFYNRETAIVAEELIGKLLVRRLKNRTVICRIVETEAYLGTEDPACHVRNGLTPRTRNSFGNPGHAYVFLTYGIHHCLNAITLEDPPYGCVLIRALEPLDDEATPLDRRDATAPRTDGPGKLTRELEIDRSLDGHPLATPPLSIVGNGEAPEVAVGPRIGISRATDWQLRFAEAGNPWVSSPKPG